MRINYNKHNYCSHCVAVHPKNKIRCPECSRKLRRKPNPSHTAKDRRYYEKNKA